MPPTKKALFICKGNYFRSQMATAIYNKLTSGNNADSVGTYVGAPDEPAGQLLSSLFKDDMSFLEMMAEKGMDIKNNRTKKLQPEMLGQYDMVVSMAEEPYIPDFLKDNKKVIWWQVENPDQVPRNVAEATYKKIYNLVKTLI